ncbi:hypothetical protein Cni_G11204 [Canna indica]|uniref:BED-type domain-containing protein n=1 Tax=Canna indica TaxID=4628 RepID=A0AAQ3K5V0_9LILI|nr:hypothetical protein Cni_G11204 [Canna indica]
MAPKSQVDPAWQHGVRLEKANHWKCIHCNMISRGGGVSRLKAHLAGTSSDVVKCTQASPEVRQMFKDMLTNKKEQRLKNAAQQAEFDRRATQDVSGGHYEARGGDNDEDPELEAGIRASLEHAEFERERMYYPGSQFEYGGGSGSGGISSVGSTSAAGAMDRSGPILSGPYIGRSSSMRGPQTQSRGSSRGGLRGFFTNFGASGRKTNINVSDLDPRAFPPPSAKQPRIDDMYSKSKKWELGRAISKWFHFSRIPANAANNPYYRTMVSTIQKVGPGCQRKAGATVTSAFPSSPCAPPPPFHFGVSQSVKRSLANCNILLGFWPKRMMMLPNFGSLVTDSANRRAYICRFGLVAAFICMALLVGSPSLVTHYKQRISPAWAKSENLHSAESRPCKIQCKPSGSEPLPEGIIRRTSNLEMQPIWGLSKSLKTKGTKRASKSLLAMAVGIKQKEVVNQIVGKFSPSKFTVMLFHYDGVVDEWRDLQWNDRTLHLSAINQTKWWFAKRFLHPDIVAEYEYIFLWDEDLGVEHFNPERYISIVEKEGLEISQPALDTNKSEVHHQITARGRKGDVHRRVYKLKSNGGCYKNSTSPPCTGWVEMMAPVFSRTAWRCVWSMIQNDLIHAWGLDMKLGYCVQGDRSKNIGVVDSEYIVHMGIPTLGGFEDNKTNTETSGQASNSDQLYSGTMVPPGSASYTDRSAIRRRSYTELKLFHKRWKRAVAKDECWIDPYPEPTKKLIR